MSRRGHPPRPRQPLYSSKSASLLLPPLPPAPADSEPLEMRSAAMIAFDNRKLNQSILKQLEDERKLEKKLEHEILRMMPLKQQLKRSSTSLTMLRRVDFSAVKLHNAQKGEREYHTRKTSIKTREIATVAAGASRTNDGYVPWRPTNHRPDTGTAADLLTQPPPTLDPMKTRSAAASAVMDVDVHKMARLLTGPGAYSPEQAHLHLVSENLRKQWRAAAAEEVSDDEEEESTSQLLTLLGGKGVQNRKAIEVFLELDADRDGQVSRKDLTERLIQLGAADDASTREEIGRFFERLDVDFSDSIGYDELREMLQKNRKIRLKSRLRDGAVGEESWREARNRQPLRHGDKSIRRDAFRPLESIDDLRGYLLSSAGKVWDLFKRLDVDGDGYISRRDLDASLPSLGFDTEDAGPGVIDSIYDELTAHSSSSGGSGSGRSFGATYQDLFESCRHGLSVELEDKRLHAGAFGEISPRAKQRHALRGGDVHVRRNLKMLTSLDDLREEMSLHAGRIVDLLRKLDQDHDQKVTRIEFRQALPILGYDASDTELVDELFDELDEDGSGEIEFDELQSALKRRVELAKELQDGYLGEDVYLGRNKHAIRTSVTERRGAPKGVATVEALRLSLLQNAGRVSDLFRALGGKDRYDGQVRREEQTVTREEFRVALPLLGYDASDTAAVDSLFDELDDDKSGEVDMRELSAKVRQGLSVELAAELQDGAVDTTAFLTRNRFSLRTSLDERRPEYLEKLTSLEQLRLKLLEGAGKVISLFKAFDRDGDGLITREEFRTVLPLLGFGVDKEEGKEGEGKDKEEGRGDADEEEDIVAQIFDELDEDLSGTLSYEELYSKLRAGLSVELAQELQDGALGEMEDWGSGGGGGRSKGAMEEEEEEGEEEEEEEADAAAAPLKKKEKEVEEAERRANEPWRLGQRFVSYAESSSRSRWPRDARPFVSYDLTLSAGGGDARGGGAESASVDAEDEGDDEEEMAAAAARMQSIQRGRLARRERDEQRQAATRVQAARRGGQARRQASAAKQERDEQAAAATKMQARQRGRNARRSSGGA